MSSVARHNWRTFHFHQFERKLPTLEECEVLFNISFGETHSLINI